MVQSVKKIQEMGEVGQVRGMKVRSSVKKLCEGCKVRFSFRFSLEKGRAEEELELGWLGLTVYRVLGGKEGRVARDMCISSAR